MSTVTPSAEVSSGFTLTDSQRSAIDLAARAAVSAGNGRRAFLSGIAGIAARATTTLTRAANAPRALDPEGIVRDAVIAARKNELDALDAREAQCRRVRSSVENGTFLDDFAFQTEAEMVDILLTAGVSKKDIKEILSPTAPKDIPANATPVMA
jgi:hypothetical protein